MKRITITGIFLILAIYKAFPQDNEKARPYVVEPFELAITFYKTTNLVFPYAIKSVDRGSKYVLAQKAKGVENVLQVKAGKKGLSETNLTVITADGKLYSYLLNYAEDPQALTIRYGKSPARQMPRAFFTKAVSNPADILENAAKIIGKKRTVYGIKDRVQGMKLQLHGLYVHDGVMYYQIWVQNRSNINYHVGQVRFFIRDRKQPKRTATQELEVSPLYMDKHANIITGKSDMTFVFALPKSPVPHGKYLYIEVMEKRGAGT